MDDADERNFAIYDERKKGATYAEISRRYGLSQTVVMKICTKEEKKIALATDSVYSALRAVSNDENQVIRTYNFLRKAGIESRENLTSLLNRDYKKLRGIGAASATIIEDAIKYCLCTDGK